MPKEAATWIVNHPQEKIAILFGGEPSGLTADNIQLCQQVLTIPGNPNYDTFKPYRCSANSLL